MTDMTDVALIPRRLCETRAGNLAHAVGRVLFRKGQPMLVEHICGALLMHDLRGRVVTSGFGPDYDIVYVAGEWA